MVLHTVARVCAALGNTLYIPDLSLVSTTPHCREVSTESETAGTLNERIVLAAGSARQMG